MGTRYASRVELRGDQLVLRTFTQPKPEHIVTRLLHRPRTSFAIAAADAIGLREAILIDSMARSARR